MLRLSLVQSFRSWVCLLALLALASGCDRGSAPPSRPSASAIHIQLGTDPVSFDPTLAEDGASLKILYNTMEGLVGYDGAGKLQNFLAESYRVLQGGKRYEFTLRAGVQWSDGKPVSPDDFVTAFKRALTPGSGSKLAGMLFEIRGARSFFAGHSETPLGVRSEAGRLVIELDRPAPYWLQVLTLPVAMPQRQDVLDAHGGRWPETAPGTGPYRMARYEANRRIVLEPNSHYWEISRKIPPVEVVIVADDNTGMHLFEQGRLDILTKLPSAELKRLKAKGVVRTDPFLATFYLSFDFKKPPFNSSSWRRAVAGSIRRDELVRVLDQGEVPASGWLPPGLEGHLPYEDPAPRFQSDVSTVKSALKTAAPSVSNVTAAFDTSHRNTVIMEKVQQDLQGALGFKLSLSNLDWKTYLKSVQTSPPSLFRLGILSPFMDPMQILQSFTTGDPNNYLKWSDRRYDQLVSEIGVMAPGKERTRKIREAQSILVDQEAIVVPLYHYVQNHAVSSRITGFRVNPFGVIRFHELGIQAQGNGK